MGKTNPIGNHVEPENAEGQQVANGAPIPPEQARPHDTARNKIDAVRRIRAALLAENPVEPRPADIYELFQRTKWSVKDKVKDTNYISATLSQIRRQGGEGAGRGSGTPLLPPVPSEPSMAELLKVRDLAKSSGGIEALADMVAKVESLASELGGLDRLKQTVAALRELTRG